MFKWLKRYLPNKKKITTHSFLKPFNAYIHNANIWHLNCSSVARGTAVGLFILFTPLPFQMVIAAFIAIFVAANLPVAVAITWINNPFTFIPINYFVYWVGNKILNPGSAAITFETLNTRLAGQSLWSSLMVQYSQLGKAYFIGLPIVAISFAALGYMIVHALCVFNSFLRNKRLKKKKTRQ